MLEYVLFKCTDGKNCKYLPVLKRSWENRYLYYRISFIPKKKLTKYTIRRLSNLTSYIFNIAKDDDEYLNMYFCCDHATIVYKYTI